MFKKGNIPYNKGKKGWTNKGSFEKGHKVNLGKKNALEYKFTDEQLEKRKGENNYNWKGEKVGYFASHSWIIKNYGNAKFCQFNGHMAKKST